MCYIWQVRKPYDVFKIEADVAVAHIEQFAELISDEVISKSHLKNRR
jgi:hypothetical protein